MSDVPSINSDWQSRGSLSDSLWFMVEKQLMCDVIFEVGKEYERIGAHSAVLSARSSVFFDQFSANIPDAKEIELDETLPRHFMLFLRYLYTGLVDIPESDKDALMTLAETYKVTNLYENILADKFSTMTIEKFCVFADRYDSFSPHVQAKCLDHVFLHAEEVFKCKEFESVPYSFLLDIVGSEYLVLDEEVICTSVLLWATKECDSTKIDVNGANQRAVLKDILMHVRFGLLQQDFFTENISEKGLLTAEEELTYLKYFLTKKAPENKKFKPRKAPEGLFSKVSLPSKLQQSLSFTSLSSSISQNDCKNENGASSNVSRQSSKDEDSKAETSTQKFEIMRFKFEGQGWGYRNNKTDAVALSSSRRIRLESIYVYGTSKQTGKVNVTVIIKHEERDIFKDVVEMECVKKNKKYEISIENNTGMKGVVLEKDEMYHIVVTLDADSGHYGKGGSSCVEDGDVKINFMRSKFSTNNTTESIGQIPGFRYSLC